MFRRETGGDCEVYYVVLFNFFGLLFFSVDSELRSAWLNPPGLRSRGAPTDRMWTEWCMTDILYPADWVLPIHFQRSSFQEFHSNQTTVEFHTRKAFALSRLRSRLLLRTTVKTYGMKHYTLYSNILELVMRPAAYGATFYVMISGTNLASPRLQNRHPTASSWEKTPQKEQHCVLLNMSDNWRFLERS